MTEYSRFMPYCHLSDEPLKVRVGIKIDPPEAGFVTAGTKESDMVIWESHEELPFGNGSVDWLFADYFLHTIKSDRRLWFYDEVWRVLRTGGTFQVRVPHWSSDRAYADPLAAWPPFAVESFLPLNAKWREQVESALPLKCNLGALDPQGNPMLPYGYGWHPEFNTRSDEFKQFAQRWYINANLDIHVSLTKLE